MATQIQLRRDTAANWTSTNPVLVQGEPGLETDTSKIKYGDGTTAWNSLAYQAAANIADGTIVNADVNASAAIAGTKISPDFGSQNAVTTGTNTAASFIPTGSSVPTNGVYLPAANTVGVASNGTGRLFINSSGQIGVGTSTPKTSLHVNGQIAQVGNGYWGSNIYFDGSTWRFLANGYGGFIKPADASGYMSFVLADSNNDGGADAAATINTRMVITTGGSVGIGTTSPSAPLQIQDSQTDGLTNTGLVVSSFMPRIVLNDRSASQAYVDIRNDSTGGTGQLIVGYGPNTDFATRTGERFRIDANGRMGIGTSSPDALLTVNGVGAFGAGSAAAPSIAFTGDLNTGLFSPGADQVAVATNGTGRLFVDASGRLLLGASTAASLSGGTPSFYVQGTSASTANGSIVRTNGAAQFSLARGSSGNNATATCGNFSFQGYDGAAYGVISNITATVDGSVSSGSTPGTLIFNTTPSGSATATERLRITSAGLVGIGTSAPSFALDVQSGDVRFKRAATNDAAIYFGSNTSNYIYSGNANNILTIATNNVERLRIDSSGRCGIGTTSPGANLELGTVASANQSLKINSTGNNYLELSTTGATGEHKITAGNSASGTAQLIFETASGGTESERLRIDSSGRLLIGTSSTSQAARAIFQGNNSSDVGVVRLALNGNSPASGDTIGSLVFANNLHENLGDIFFVRDGGTWTAGSSYPTRLVFRTTADGASSPTERMRITNGGQLLIGTATNFGNSTRVEVSFAGALQEYGLGLNAESLTSGSTQWVEFTSGAGTQRGSISWSGTAVQYNTSSDYRLKENIAPIANGIARLQQLKPNRFNYIEYPGLTVDGFIAHEVQSVVPEAISGEKDAVDDDGNPVYQGIDQSKLVPLLTAALQEAVTRIEQLEGAVTALQQS